MDFWIRHAVLLILCVIAPFTAALYADTSSTVEQAKQTSQRSLRLAVRGLQLILQNEAYVAVSSAMSTAQRALDKDRFADMRSSGNRGETAVSDLLQLLNDAAPRNGFAWLADSDGKVLLTNGSKAIAESPRSIRGHPIFSETQIGYALDGVWSSHDELVEVAAAPLVDDGEIKGAILVGHPLDETAIREWAETLGVHITLASDKSVVVSSASGTLAQTIVEAAFEAVSPVYAGDREEAITDGSFSFLPLLVDHHVSGEAYVSIGTPVLGAPSRFQWVISVDAVEGFGGLAERQSVVLGGMVAAFLIALLIGIINYRSFVVPNDRISEHLSEVQMGRGAAELPEASVSRPFRRMVRLINMIVQRIPNRAVVPTADLSSIVRPTSLEEDLVLSEMPNVASSVPVPTPVGAPSGLPIAVVAPDGSNHDGAAGSGSISLTNDAREAAELLAAPEKLDDLALDSLPPAVSSAPPPMAEHSNGGGRSHDISADLHGMAASASASAFNPASLDLESLGVPATPGAEAAIADAIAQLEGASSVQYDSVNADGLGKSANAIRGRPMGGSMPGVDAPPFDEVSVPSATLGPPPGARGGGSLDLSQAAALRDDPRPPFGPEETVVAPVASELLAQSARDDLTGRHAVPVPARSDATEIANLPGGLVAQGADSAAPARASGRPQPNLDPDDEVHFKEVYDRFIDLRRRCGESTDELAFERFLSKLTRNRENLIKKYNCRTVRFQVYKKDGKAALKATPVGGGAR